MRSMTKAPIMLSVAILVFSGCAATLPSATSGGEPVSDMVVTTRVKAAMVNDPALSMAPIDVQTFHGTVQLSGLAATPEVVSKATKVAQAVSGVKAVTNTIQTR